MIGVTVDDVTLLQALLSDLVRGGMARTKLNQRKLAAAAQISEKYLSEMLRGRSQGSIEVWDRLLRAVDSPLVSGWTEKLLRARNDAP